MANCVVQEAYPWIVRGALRSYCHSDQVGFADNPLRRLEGIHRTAEAPIACIALGMQDRVATGVDAALGQNQSSIGTLHA